MNIFGILFLFLFCVNYHSYAQDKVIIADFEVVDDDTIFFSDLREVEILEFKSKEEKINYHYLRRRVLKVYPYALIAKEKLEEIQTSLDSIPRRKQRKRYTKEVTRWVKEEYSDRLKLLTMKEGKILVKLIYRETNTTSYEILKSHKGRFNAFFWQTMAKLWNNNLKTKYDPVNIKEDMLIEHILIEAKLEGRIKD